MAEVNSEICTDSDIYVGKVVSKMYDVKARQNSVLKRHFKLKSPRNINRDNFEAIVAICGSERTKFVLETEPKYELTGGGMFFIKKYPTGYKIDINRYEKIKRKSQKFGIDLDNIGITYETDGNTSNENGISVKTLTHDVLIATFKGDRRFLRSQILTPNVEYLEIDRRLEKQIYEYEVQKDMEKFKNKTEEEINELYKEYEKTGSLFTQIFNFFKS
jgi:hypothetical protein